MAKVIVSDSRSAVAASAARNPPGPFALAVQRFFRNPVMRVVFFIVVAYIVLAFTAPILPLAAPSTMNEGAELQPPSWEHLLGTDEFGRDILSRVIYGARISLLVAATATLIGTTIGVSTGVIAAFSGGWVETIVMRIYDALLAFPTLLLAIGIAAMTGTGVFNAALALAIVGIPRFARVARSGVLVERNKEYVQAAVSVGARASRIMFRHILPNISGPVLVDVTIFMAFAVLIEASLSFLGLGAQPPTPSLGSMLNQGRPYLRSAPWYSIAPGAALTLLIFSLNTLSDGARDALDPRSRR